jgi:acyl-CoA reductase-like NAD-dependent aldehyde dehydrogenase
MTLLVAEGGLTQQEARASLQAAEAALQYPPAPGSKSVGRVRAVIGPAASPLVPVVRDVTMALMSGDTVVVRPPAGAELLQLLLARAWAALPAGVVNVVVGDSNLASYLAGHHSVGAVSFTGSAAVGDLLAQSGKPVDATVGRLDAAVLRPDADVDLAVRAIAWSRLRHGGRSCLSSRRIFVPVAMAADFSMRLHQYAGLLEVDDPAIASVRIGPLGSAEAAKVCENRVVKTMRAGARLVLGGFRFRPAGLKGGWLQPTILADVPLDAPPHREELLGPVLTVSSYADDVELRGLLGQGGAPAGIALYGVDEDAVCAWAADLPAAALWVNVPQSDCAWPPLNGPSRPVFRPAYAAGALPDFFELDPLRCWSAT